ncbi:MAG: RNA polymerase sigma factor [Gemmataceae bacterium]|nr:RNA polymerase sigma factor [Gemmataceae bacterium]
MSEVGATPMAGRTPNEKAAVPAETLLLRAFQDHRDELVSTLMFLLGNAEDAQDAAQDTFLKCWRNRAEVAQIHNLRAWIFRIGLNTARDMQRSGWSRKSRPLAGDELMYTARDVPPAKALEDQEALERLRLAILELRTEEKEVFLLRQNGGFTYEQIAEMRSAPVGTVKTQMRSALQKLRKILT